MGQIIVGVDGSPAAAAALRWAVEEAATRGWPVTAVLAWDLLNQHHPIGERPEFRPSYTEADARRALDSYVASALGTQGATAVERHVVCDLTVPALLRLSEEADLLVVGTASVRRVRRLIDGSVSQRCVHGAGCPVVVVRAGDATGDRAAGRPLGAARD